MNYRDPEFEHWPHYEDITDTYYRHGRFFYGEDQDGRLRTGGSSPSTGSSTGSLGL
jgi:hypothetical protein